MGRLLYSAIASLDGYVADSGGDFSWAAPDAEVHGFVNDLERSVGTYLLGRRMYEVMSWWDTAAVVGEPAVVQDFARLWRAADKVVYSTTLDAVSADRTRLERTFDVEQVRELVARSPHDVSVGGPTLAGEALRAGLVAEISLLLVPEVVGGGTRALPDGLTMGLALHEVHRFGSGTVHLRYRPR